MFSDTSRYKRVKDYLAVDSNGAVNQAKRIRFIPRYETAKYYLAKEYDRLDLLANVFYKDPTKFWLICDANDVMFPSDLLKAGKKIIIPKERE
ncbi:hypothetical protein DYY67_1385 [Candidatus Nitrosotalea sp. TS]|uniref:hypothetical protein n=1 Tax=Candidatus Nitrosotalea sp. TS TaxID=2341020 RepID=UPI00140D44FF|nr:hypothetical protein [Candidatus Nitrosotalea sp. TS]NHI03590.1 hypothetical protein [Candidatus Nitrosotalea sp. TS]